MTRPLPWCAVAWAWSWVLWFGLPLGHDLPLELMRLAQYRAALADGQLLPLWAPDLYAGHGSPVFLLYGHVALLMAAGWSALTSLGTGLLLSLVSASVLAVWGMQLLAAAFERPAAGRVAACLFVLNPYLLGDALLRNACAEYVALCGMPLGLAGLVWLSRANPRGMCWLALATGWIVAAHNLTALTWCAGVLLSIAAVPGLRTRGLRALEALGAGLALSAFVWWPALVWKSQIRTGDLTTGRFDYHANFQPLSHMFGFEHFASAGPLPPIAAGIAALLATRAEPNLRAWIYTLLLLTLACVLMQTRLSLPVWEHLGVLAFYQFPFRFMGPLACATAVLGGLAFTLQHTPRAEWAVLLLCMLLSAAPLRQVKRLPSAHQTELLQLLEPRRLRTVPQSGTVADEYLPAHASTTGLLERASTAPIASATAGLRIAIRSARPRSIRLDVKAERPSELCLTRWWFPFWQLTLDGQPQTSSPCADGSVRLTTPSGRHQLTAELHTPRERTGGVCLAGLGLLWLAWRWRASKRLEVTHQV